MTETPAVGRVGVDQTGEEAQTATTKMTGEANVFPASQVCVNEADIEYEVVSYYVPQYGRPQRVSSAIRQTFSEMSGSLAADSSASVEAAEEVKQGKEVKAKQERREKNLQATDGQREEEILKAEATNTGGWLVKLVRGISSSSCAAPSPHAKAAAAATAAATAATSGEAVSNVRPPSYSSSSSPTKPTEDSLRPQRSSGTTKKATSRPAALSICNVPLVEAGKYEGGFSIWESSWDLLQYMLQQISSSSSAFDGEKASTGSHILDLGCGHGLAGLLMLLRGNAAAVVFQDYNREVLLEVTAPTVALNWCSCRQQPPSHKVSDSVAPPRAAEARSFYHRLCVCTSGAPAAACCCPSDDNVLHPHTDAAVGPASPPVVAPGGRNEVSGDSAGVAIPLTRSWGPCRSVSLSDACRGAAAEYYQPQSPDDQRGQQQSDFVASNAAPCVSGPLLPREPLRFPQNCLLVPCSWSEFPPLCCSCCCTCGDAAVCPQGAQQITASPGSSCCCSQSSRLSFDWILASECLYRPSCFPALYHILLELLTPETGRAVFAAKRFYFGLDGGTLPFKQFIEEAEQQRDLQSHSAAAAPSSMVSNVRRTAHSFTNVACNENQLVANGSFRCGENIQENKSAQDDVRCRRCHGSRTGGEHACAKRLATETRLHVDVAWTTEDGSSNIRDILVISKRRPCLWNRYLPR